MADLLIFDPHDNLLAVLSNEAEKACPFWNAPFREVLNQGSFFEFTAPADHADSKYLVEENQVAFMDKDGNFQLFVIKEPVKNNGENGPQITCVCEPWLNELNEEPIEDIRLYNTTLKDALTRVLAKTRVKVGEVADLGINSTNVYYTSAAEGVQKCINTWGGELSPRIELNAAGNKIAERILDVPARRGVDTGKRWEIDKDILSISHKVQSYPKTALYGRGASLETENGGYTRKITFADVEWKVANGDPVDKPKGQEWVGDPGALAIFGRINSDGTKRHRFGFYENGNQNDPEKLLQETWESLQQQKHPIHNYEMDVFLLEQITGYEHEKVRLGDTTFAIDRSFAQPIEVEERVVVYEYDVADPDNTGYVELGQYIDLYGDDDRLDKIEAKLNDKGGIWDKIEEPIKDTDFPDIKPDVPANFAAEGLFKAIQLTWEFDTASYIASYELYGSQIKGFTPDSSNLLWKGKTSGYTFTADVNQMWYFRLRAVNTHGTASEFTKEVSAQTARIISDDILFGEDIAAKLRELSKVADLLAEGTVSWEQISEAAKSTIHVQAKQYTDAEIAAVEQSIMNTVNTQIGDVDAKIATLNTQVDEVQSKISEVETDMGNLQTTVNADIANLNTTAADLLTRLAANEAALQANSGKITTVEEEIDTINGTLSTTITQLSSLEGTVSEQQTQINANANAISLKASQTSVDTLTGRITTAEGNISTIAGQITLKANAADVYTKAQMNTELGKKVDTTVYNNKMSQLDVSISGIQANVSNIESEVSDVDSRLTHAQSQIDMQAGAIALKANKSEVYTKTEADGKINTAITNAKAEIKVTTDGISQTVSNLTSKVDNIQVGGRNLLKGSDLSKQVKGTPFTVDGKTYDTYCSGYAYYHGGITNPSTNYHSYIDNDTFGFPVVVYNESNGARNWKGSSISVKEQITESGEYTVSFDAYATGEGTKIFGGFYYTKVGGTTKGFHSGQFNIRVDKINQWHRISGTCKLGDDVDFTQPIAFYFYGYGFATNSILYIRKHKLEKGNKATDWTPAPEDIDSEFVTVKESISSIDQKADSISLTVSNLQSTVTSQGTRLSNAETTISQHTTSINLKANATDVYKKSEIDTKLNTKVDTTVYNNKMAQLDVSINGINASVSDIRSDVSNIDTRLSSAQSQLNVQAGQIAAKAEKSYVDSATNSLSSQIAALNVRADGIQSSISNIRIGGRNLLRFTDFSNIDHAKEWVNIDNTSPIEPRIFAGFPRTFGYISIGQSAVGYHPRIRSKYNIDLVPGQTYTISWIGITSDFVNSDFNWSGIIGTGGTFQHQFVGGLNKEKIGEVNAFGYTKSVYHYFHTFTYSGTQTTGLALMIGSTVTTASAPWIAITDVQLEHGNMATSWTLAPEDTEQRMSIAESTITQLSNQIDLKVDVDRVVSQINLSQEGVRIKGSLITLDGTTLIATGVIGTAAIANGAITKAKLGTAIIGYAQMEKAIITDDLIAPNAKIDGAKIADATITSAKIASLDATKITAGILRSINSNMELNLSTGSLTMRNANFTLGGGADVEFSDVGNRMYFKQYDPVGGITRSAGFGVGRSINDRFPYAFLGTTNTSKPNAMDDENFTGFITNTNQRMLTDGIGNSVVGGIFHVRDKAVSFTRGFEFLIGTDQTRKTIRPMNTGTYTYDLGDDNSHFDRVYVKEARTNVGYFDIRNTSVPDQGFRFETVYGSESHISFYGVLAGTQYYNLGKSNRRFRYVYLAYQPDVSSDIRLKENIADNTLGLDFINDIETKTFNLKSDRNEPTQYGIIAQQLRDTLLKHGVDVQNINMLSQGADGMYGVQYTQFIAPLIKAVQELDKKYTDEVEKLILKNANLEMRVAELERKWEVESYASKN